MSESQLKDLNRRLQALEERDSGWVRFFLQYLLAPILVIAMGFFFNSELEKQKAELTQLKLAQEILPALFAEDPHQGFAAQRLMRHALADQKISEEIANLVTNYYLSRLQVFIENGDAESASRIAQAAQSVGGDLGMQFVIKVQEDEQRAAALSNYEIAIEQERKGFQSLIDGQYEDAIRAFEAAEQAYPRFHQVYEIGRLIKNNQTRLDDSEVRREIFKRIIDEMSWKAPANQLERMKQEVMSAG